ncbi:MAG: DUF819 family protein [Flavobacteriales bacterium]|nr:DUF819 family protein [Flavobacteriales bacterium]MDG1766784.1 DUF819 family protein [Flavobacteriales bacterium]
MEETIEKIPPLITNDAVVLGILLVILGGLFYLNKLKAFQQFFRFVPLLLLCYFIPAIVNSLNIIDGETSNLYFVASRYLLPAALILLCLSIDLKGIISLGPKAIIMFFSATVGIVIGGPIALLAVSAIEPSVLGGDDPEAYWRGLSTIAGSWIGGGANQTAMKEISETTDTQFSAMIIVDVVVANIWMAVLLIGAGMSARIDRWFKADNSAVENLKSRVESYQASIQRYTTFPDLMVIAAIAFGGVAVAHLVADGLSPSISKNFSAILSENPDSWVQYLSSLESGFFWLIITATLVGIALSFTKARNYEGAGSSKIGSVFLYVLVGTLGMKMDLPELINNWDQYWAVILIGLIWMFVHIVFLLIMAYIVKAPFFFVAVGSQANVGGAASAPVVASAFSPALAPVGVLLAVLGYAVGTVAAILCMGIMHSVSM